MSIQRKYVYYQKHTFTTHISIAKKKGFIQNKIANVLNVTLFGRGHVMSFQTEN